MSRPAPAGVSRHLERVKAEARAMDEAKARGGGENDATSENSPGGGGMARAQAAGPLELVIEYQPAGGAALFRGQRVLVTGAAGKVSVGRLPGNTLPVAGDGQVSKRHCAIRAGVVTDLGSTNGTFVNDRRLDAPHLLVPGDVLRCGATRIGSVVPAPRPAAARRPRANGTMIAGPTLDADGDDGLRVSDDTTFGFILAPKLPSKTGRARRAKPDAPVRPRRTGTLKKPREEEEAAGGAAAEEARKEPRQEEEQAAPPPPPPPRSDKKKRKEKKAGLLKRLFGRGGKDAEAAAEEKRSLEAGPGAGYPDRKWKNSSGTMRFGSPPASPAGARPRAATVPAAAPATPPRVAATTRTPERAASRPSQHMNTLEAPPARMDTLRAPPAGGAAHMDTMRAPPAGGAAHMDTMRAPAPGGAAHMDTMRAPAPGGAAHMDTMRAPPGASPRPCGSCADKDAYIELLQDEVLQLQQSLNEMRTVIQRARFAQMHNENSQIELDQSKALMVSLHSELGGLIDDEAARDSGPPAAAGAPPPPPRPAAAAVRRATLRKGQAAAAAAASPGGAAAVGRPGRRPAARPAAAPRKRDEHPVWRPHGAARGGHKDKEENDDDDDTWSDLSSDESSLSDTSDSSLSDSSLSGSSVSSSASDSEGPGRPSPRAPPTPRRRSERRERRSRGRRRRRSGDRDELPQAAAERHPPRYTSTPPRAEWPSAFPEDDEPEGPRRG